MSGLLEECGRLYPCSPSRAEIKARKLKLCYLQYPAPLKGIAD
jgi:hypothetical protein